MKTKLTLKDMEIMLKNNIAVCSLGGYPKGTVKERYYPYEDMVRGLIYPYKIEDRDTIIKTLKKLGYWYEYDTSIFGYEHCFIFSLEPTPYDDIWKVSKKYEETR